METFGAWLFIIGLFLHPVISILGCILSTKYEDDSYLNEVILNMSNHLQFLCWTFIAGGMLLVYYF